MPLAAAPFERNFDACGGHVFLADRGYHYHSASSCVLAAMDVGGLDEAGNRFIKDRKNDLIIRGGANVYPAEVERVLYDVDTVAACAVVGVRDERLGERVVAVVQLVPDATVDPEELREHCRANLAKYKVPDTVEFVDAFDRTPMGKIRKTVLRERMAAP